MPDTGILNFDMQDFKHSARTFRRELLRLPILGIADELKYMTQRLGVRYSEVVGSSEFDVQFRPYKQGSRTKKDLDLKLRDLRTYFGALDVDFEPNSAIQTILGHAASQAAGDALQTAPTALEVLALAAKSPAYHFKTAIFSAVRDDNGKTTQELFDGFDTITASEIAAGNISVAKRNLLELDAKPDADNAYEIAKKILRSMSDELRMQQCFLFCSQNFADNYNDAYLKSHPAVQYNTQFNQISVEGSNGLLTIVPLIGKKDSDFIHVSPKANMLVGMDQLSDMESVKVGDYDPDLITLSMRMFFGVQFESIDPRRLLVAKIPD